MGQVVVCSHFFCGNGRDSLAMMIFFVNASVSDKITGRRTIKQHARGKNEQFASHGTKCSVASLNSQIFKITQRRHLEFVGKKPKFI